MLNNSLFFINEKPIMKYSYIFLFIFPFLLCCNKPKSITSQFSNSSKLYTDNTLAIEEVYIKMPQIYNLTDSTLIITALTINHSSDKYLIYIASKKTGKIIKRLGAEGRGPEEMISVSNISTLNNEILFYDSVGRKILHYNFSNDSVYFQTIVSQKKFFLINLYLINDNKFISSGVFGKNMYIYGNIITGKGLYYLEYPFLPDVSKEKQKDLTLARHYAYIGGMIKHPDFPKFIYYSGLAEYLQIIELNGDTLKEVMHLSFAPPIGKVVYNVDAYVWATNSQLAHACFIRGTASNKYIYLLYSGKPIKENDFIKSKYIFIFDWDGKAIKILELDKEVYSICVDEEDHEIYAYTTNDKTLKNEILHYTL